jgi:RNA polymerase sigma-70 factor (ECF subfamily)
VFEVWMPNEDPEVRWRRLLELLAPVHEQAAATARRLTRSEDADDLLQASVLRAFEKLPTLRDPARFRGWFYAVLLSVHRTRSRWSFWRRFLPLEEAVAEPPGEDGVRTQEERDRTERLRRALTRLPAPQREAIVLFELEGFSVEEIAGMQDVSISAVKSRLSRGRRRLRRHYARLFGESTGNAPAGHRLMTGGETR